MSCSCVLFDLFDTLCWVDEESYCKGKRAASKAAGLDFDTFMDCWRKTAHDAVLGKLITPYSRASKALAMAGCDEDEAVAAVARLDVEGVLDSTFLYDGAIETLSKIRGRGRKLGLLSNASPATAFLISRFNLRSAFDFLILSYEVGVAKPDPEIYEKALARSESKPEETIFIGDGANDELDGAAAAGIIPVRITHERQSLSFLDKGRMSSKDYPEVKSFKELLALQFFN